MRALTLHRPWDWAILMSAEGVWKDLENRTTKPPSKLVGQYIALHSGLVLDYAAAERIRHLLGPAATLRPGYIHGLVRITGFVTASKSHWFRGPYAWTLADRVVLKLPVAARGMQGLWPVPAEAQRRIIEQLPTSVLAEVQP